MLTNPNYIPDHGHAGAAPDAFEAFAEDRTMIEAQQRIIDGTSVPRVMPTGADRAITLFNQMIAKRVRAERSADSSLAARGNLAATVSS